MRWRRVAAAGLSSGYVVLVVGAAAAAAGNRTATLLAPIIVAFTMPRVAGAAGRMTGASRDPHKALLDVAAALAEVVDPDDALEALPAAVVAATGARAAHVHVGGSVPVARSGDGVAVVQIGGIAAIVVETVPGREIPRDVLEGIAAQVAPTIRNLLARRELAARVRDLEAKAAELAAARRRVLEVGDAERQNLERDLHDGAQQCLMALVLRLGLRRPRDPEVVESLLARARSTLEAASGGWAAAGLEHQGLAESLRRHFADVEGVHVESAVLPELAPPVERAAFFTCVEAVQNALKHACATSVEVRIDVVDDELRFGVIDDGVGFDPDAVTAGYGLSGVRDRVAAFDGSLRLVSAPGRGTTFSCSLPLTIEAAA